MTCPTSGSPPQDGDVRRAVDALLAVTADGVQHARCTLDGVALTVVRTALLERAVAAVFCLAGVAVVCVAVLAGAAGRCGW